MIYVRGKKGILDSAQFIHEVWALRYRKGELSRKYAGPNTIVGHTHALPTLIVPVRFYEELCQTLNASKSVRNWTPNRAEVDSACLGREPEPPFAPRARTFLGSHPVVPCGPRKVEFGRYDATATRNMYGSRPEWDQSRDQSPRINKAKYFRQLIHVFF